MDRARTTNESAWFFFACSARSAVQLLRSTPTPIFHRRARKERKGIQNVRSKLAEICRVILYVLFMRCGSTVTF
jgi:hypothetical protein